MASVVLSPNWRRWFLLDLYEQCSDHITEYMASSAAVGRRPRLSRMRWYSSGLRPSSANGCSWSGVAAATSTVSVWGARAGAVVIDSLGGDPWAGTDQAARQRGRRRQTRTGYRRPDAVRSSVRADEFPGNC